MFKKLLISGLLLLSFNVFSAPVLNVGDTFPDIEINNQRASKVTVSGDTKTILFTVDKAPSQLLNKFLIKHDDGFLTKNNAFYLADISGMPSLISKFIAIPKLKKYAYDILLIKKESHEQFLFVPRKETFITVLKVVGNKIKTIEFVKNNEQLEKVFK